MQLTHIPASGDDTRDDTEMCVCIYSGDACGDSCSQKASTSLVVRCRRVMGRTYMCAHVVGTARSDLGAQFIDLYNLTRKAHNPPEIPNVFLIRM